MDTAPMPASLPAANVMDLLDSTIVNIAAPSVHRDLGGGANTIRWLSAAYTLAFAVLLVGLLGATAA